VRFMVATASTGYCPAADSADSMIASAPSKIAVATSETSARVGTGLVIMDSSIWVATTPGFEIGAVLLRQRRERHGRVGEAHAFAVGQFSTDFDAREDMVAVGLDGDEAHLAVVEQECVAGLDGGEDFGVRQVHPLGIAGRWIGVEREGITLGERGRIIREAAEPELWALEIEQEPDS